MTSEDNSINSQLAGASQTTSLFGAIDKDNVYGLNLAVPENAKAIIKPWNDREDTTRYADSGVDDQLIIHIPFTHNVRLKSVVLKLGRGESAPRHLRIYANHPNIVDFADAEITKPQLDISLLEGEVSATEYPLRVAAFASVTSLSLFFSESVGEELSRIFFIGFKGDIRSFSRDPNTTLDIPAANAPDARVVDRLSEKTGGQQTTAR